MKKFKSIFLCGLCAVVLSVGIGCCVGLLKNDKTYAQTVEVSNFEQLQNAVLKDSSKIVVSSDIVFSSTLQIDKNVLICSDGDFSLKRSDGFGGSLISILSGGSVEISSQNGTTISLDGENVFGTASAVSNNGTFVLGKNAIIKNFKANAIKGVALYSKGAFSLKGGEILNNELAGSSGNGIIYNDQNSTMNVESGKICGNTSTQTGMIYVHNGSTVKMSGGEISGNTLNAEKKTAGNGGAFYFKAAVGEFTGGKICGNTANNGGALQCGDTASIILDGVEISENTAIYEGGGVRLMSNAECLFKSGKISGNVADVRGGGLFVGDSAKVVMEDGEISSNRATQYGGAAYLITSSSMTVKGGMISSNYAKSSGGAFFLNTSGSFIMEDGQVKGNSSNNGGAWTSKKVELLQISGGTITENVSTNLGGAVYVYDAGNLTVTGGTFSNNGKVGKDIYVTGDRTLKLLGGSFSEIQCMNGVVEIDADVEISDKIKMLSSVTATNGFINILGQLKNHIVIDAFDYTPDTSSTQNTLLRLVADNPYVNVFAVLDKLSYVDSSKTQFFNGDKILLVDNENKIDVVADEFVVEVKKSASDGEDVEFHAMKEYEISNVSIVDDLGGIVSFSKTGDEYSFVMPNASGVKIDYTFAKKDLALSIDADVEEFIDCARIFKYKDLVSLTIKNVSGKRLDRLYVERGAWKQELDLSNPEFLMFEGATISGEFSITYSVSPEKVQYVDRLEFLKGEAFSAGEKVEFRVVQNKEGENAKYTLSAVYYMSGDMRIDIPKNLDGTYSFVMPNNDVEVKFEFENYFDSIEGNVIVALNENELIEALKVDDAIVAILNDIELSKTLKISHGTHTLISLNGSSVLRGATCTENMFHIGWKTVLNLGMAGQDISLFLDGNNLDTANGSVVFVEDGGIVNMYDGVIIKNNKMLGMNVAYTNFKKGNNGAAGAGVYVYNGIFNMYGGSISNNYSRFNGAGVYNYGRFNLYGGSIENNKTEKSGGAIYNYRVFLQDGGDILNNACITADGYGAGVYNGKTIYSYYYLESGKVSGNTSFANGAGVFVSAKGVTWIKGGQISDNTSMENGGGISTKGTLIVVGGEISNNSASKYGGGIYSYADTEVQSFTFVKGGKIEGNSAKHGGAFAIKEGQKVEITGGEFINNTASVSGGGIYTFVDKGLQVPQVLIKNVKLSGNTSPENSQICILDGVIEIGAGVEIVGQIVTLKAPTAGNAYIKFVEELTFELEINPFKYADYELEPYNVFVCDESVLALSLAEKIKLTNPQYILKVVENNLYICAVA